MDRETKRKIVTIVLVLLACAAVGAMLGRVTNPWTAEKTLRGHRAEAAAVALSEDAKLAASAGRDGRVIVWDLAAGREICRLEGRAITPIAICLSPNGQAVAVGFRDAPAIVWRFAEDGSVREMGPLSVGAELLAISHEGHRLITAGGAGVVRAWDWQSGKLLTSLDGGLPVAADATVLVLSASGGAALLVKPHQTSDAYDITTGQSLRWTAGSIRFASTKELSFGGRRASYQLVELQPTFTAADGREERFSRKAMVSPGRCPVVGSSKWSWSRWVPDRTVFAAFTADADRVVVGLRGGSVVLLRSRRPGDWYRTPHPWAVLVLVVALAGWLAGGRRVFPQPAAAPAPDDRQSARPRPPASLRILAYLVMAEGIGELAVTLAGPFFGRCYIGLGVLNIVAGRGLLRLNRGWREFVLFEVWLVFIVVGLMAGMIAEGQQPELDLSWARRVSPALAQPFFSAFERGFGAAPRFFTAVFLAGCLTAAAWVWWVLSSPTARALFRRPGAPDSVEPSAPEAA